MPLRNEGLWIIDHTGTISDGETHGAFDTVMKRIGSCPSSLKPGEMILAHWRVNGEETLKGRQLRNIQRNIEDGKAFIASRLSR